MMIPIGFLIVLAVILIAIVFTALIIGAVVLILVLTKKNKNKNTTAPVCTNCQTPIPADGDFCPNCGMKCR